MSVFTGVKVVEIGTGVPVAYCGKIFADFGAEVIKIEPAGGDPLRAMEPLLETDHGRQSGYFAWLNTNKKSITADPAARADAARLRSLIAGADVFLDGRSPSEIEPSFLRHEGLSNKSGNLVTCAVSLFGDNGPYRDFVATEAVCRALAGGVWNVGPAEGPPVIVPDGQSGLMTGLAAFVAVGAGLYARQEGARRFSVSMMETITHLLETEIADIATRGTARKRSGINRFGRHFPSSIYETKEGWLGLVTANPAQWKSICEIVGRPDLAKEKRFALSADRLAHADELDAIFMPLFKTKTAAEWFELGLKRRLAIAIVPTMEELLKQKVHRDRGTFVKVGIAGRSFEAPILPQRLSKAPPAPGGLAPVAGQDDAAYPGTDAKPGAVRHAKGLPLTGVRIVDLSMGWAGPLVTRQMADLGAEIIKVESCGYPDWWRGMEIDQAFFDEKKYEKSGIFNPINRNKLGITLDLTTKRGVDLFKQLVAKSHAVVENYSADVLPKLGLDYSVLSKVNPSLVMMSMPCFGSTGLWSETRAYGSTLEQASGLPTISGEAHWPPTISAWAYGDPMGGFNGAAGLMLGLLHQQRTGEGQFIDQAHVGGMVTLAAPQLIEQSATGKLRPRLGNRHPSFAPQGAYPAAGDDRWVVISIANDAQWRSLAAHIGLAERKDLESVEGRRAAHDEIDRRLKDWTRERDADAIMSTLQAEGVPAARASNVADLLADPHLLQRGFWQTIDRAFVGAHRVNSAPYREGERPYAVNSPAPTLGQHNHQVLSGVLGLSPTEIEDLERSGIIGTELVKKGSQAA